MNPNSQYYLSFDLGYPNAFDRAHGRTGAQLMVHGDCSSRGCYSMTDEQISEIYALGARRVLRRPAIVPGSGLSVPDDAAEHGQAPQQPAPRVLEDAQEGQRPFRGHAARAQGQRLREALRVRRRSRRAIRRGRCRSARPASARPTRWTQEIAAAVQRKAAARRGPVRRAGSPQYRGRAGQDRRRRRHAPGVRRRGEAQSDRRRAAGVAFVSDAARHHPADRAAAAHS